MMDDGLVGKIWMRRKLRLNHGLVMLSLLGRIGRGCRMKALEDKNEGRGWD